VRIIVGSAYREDIGAKAERTSSDTSGVLRFLSLAKGSRTTARGRNQ
jgi:hypothetical protein